MEDWTSMVKSIHCNNHHNDKNCWYEYVMNKGDKSEFWIYTGNLPLEERPERTDMIISQATTKFINGFMVVKTLNGEYGYVRESDGVLLPYRYDVAFNFNNYGFAMVARDGTAAWIDKNFNILKDDKLVPDKPGSKLDAWFSINSFSESENPLSRVYKLNNMGAFTKYFGIDGKIKTFYKYDGKIRKTYDTNHFYDSSEFNEKGHAIGKEVFIFDKGFYVYKNDFFNLSVNNKSVDNICEEAYKFFDKESKKLELKQNNINKDNK